MPGSAEAARAATFGKRADMIVRGELPFNAEPPPSVLASSEITPVDAFYARNHGPIPDVDVDQWQLTVEGADHGFSPALGGGNAVVCR
jgi:sulfite oxidase